ncbi:hypothetical protein CSKR_110947 [Clonorchis sinensis]|uniref:Uncharacterized protein n=1 Tax=Clonorchis sinensis TaxID=79923 RepID=A0A419Q6I3_CLOSI|nr:hypothetical protein CSKR_110947 [Clonorchis sinensis]
MGQIYGPLEIHIFQNFGPRFLIKIHFFSARHIGTSYHKFIYQRNKSICKQIYFCGRPTWNPAESLVYDVSKQLNVLHQAASCFSSYDIRDIAIHV